MKPIYCILLLNLFLNSNKMSSQEEITIEHFGKTLNVGSGIEYASYVGYSVPIACLNYEIEIEKKITVAPFVYVYSYQSSVNLLNSDLLGENYNYTETVIPIGFTVSYYLDELIKAKSHWDFYIAGSLGYINRQTKWTNPYYGNQKHEPGTGAMYLNIHIGTELHITKRIGFQLDVSAGKASIGIALHH